MKSLLVLIALTVAGDFAVNDGALCHATIKAVAAVPGQLVAWGNSMSGGMMPG